MYASTHARSQSTQYDRQTKIRSKQKNLCLFIPYLIPYYTRQFFDDKKTTLSHTFTDISEHHKRFHDSNRHHHPHCCCCSFVCWFVLWITILFREKHSISKLEWGCACWETKMNTCLRMVAVWFKEMLVKWQIFSPEFLSSLFKGMHKCKKTTTKRWKRSARSRLFRRGKMWFIRNEFFSVLAVDAIVLPMPKNCEHR